MKKKRIGIYGGTFSPCHIGHVRVAKAFLSAMKLDLLYVIPAKQPPHKSVSADDDPMRRYEMLKIAFRDEEKIEISDIELQREGKSYTADTLESLASPDRELYLFMGTDMFLCLDQWYHAETIFALSNIVYARRETLPENTAALREKTDAYRARFGAKIYYIDLPVTELSSSDVRQLLSAGDETAAAACLPDGVFAYIKEHGCYGVT